MNDFLNDVDSLLEDDYVIRKYRNTSSYIGDEVEPNDDEWVFDSFMVKSTELTEEDKFNRYWSITETKFTDTSLGGNIPINVYPQFTRYSDIRLKGRLSSRNEVTVNNISGNIGMGRYYGEVIDDNSFDVFMTFGVPEFNNLFTFILNAADYKQSVIANEGRSPFMYNLGQIYGIVAITMGFGVVGLAAVVLRKTLSTIYDVVAGPGRFSYYHMKPAMFEYWSSVNSLVTMFATELGLISPMFGKADKNKLGLPIKLDDEDLRFIRQYMPDIITGDNYIDVFSMITKTQRLAAYMHKKEMELYEASQKAPDVKRLARELLEAPIHVREKKSDYFKYVRETLSKSWQYGKEEPKSNSVTIKDKLPGEVEVYDKEGRIDRGNTPMDDPEKLNSVFDHYKAMLEGGATYAVFRVENPGPVSVSFNNEVGDIELEGMLKSIGSKSKSLKYDLAGGVLPGVDDLIKGLKDFAMGALDQITFGLSNVLTALLGNANLDIPKRWIDSSASFPEHTFKIRLISPYGNPISQLRNIYIPLAALMAGALPRATGPSSYTSPFLCSMFLRGYDNIKLGMITSLTIERGVSNLPFNKQRRPLAIDVTFTVTDFSKIMTVPIVTDIGMEAFTSFNQDSAINRFISTLAARNLNDSTFFVPQAKLNLARMKANVDKVFSNSYTAAKLYDITPDFVKDILENKSVNYIENQ